MEEENNGKFFVLGLAGALLLAVLAGFGMVKYEVGKLSQNQAVLFGAKVFNIPAAKINGLVVVYADYIDDMQTLEKFYTSNSYSLPKPTAEQVSDQVLSRLVANRLVGDLAKKYKAKVTAEDIKNFKAELLKQFSDEKTAEEEMQKTYGWTVAKYLDKVGRPILLEQKLQVAFASSTSAESSKFQKEELRARHILFIVDDKTSDVVAKAKGNEVLKKIKAGEDFATLASQYGSDSTKDLGGDLGWFGKGMMVQEFEDAVFKIQPGQLADELVKTQFGYHIIKLEEKRMVNDFFSFMDDQFKNAKISVLIPIHNPFEKLAETSETAEN